MPTYVYEVINPDGSGGEVFEIDQRMSDEPLTRHPETGQPVRRRPVAPHVITRYSTGGQKQQLGDKNLERLGFSRFEKSDTGEYVKTAGKGPKKIKKRK
jgi:hypothetical protein